MEEVKEQYYHRSKHNDFRISDIILVAHQERYVVMYAKLDYISTSRQTAYIVFQNISRRLK